MEKLLRHQGILRGYSARLLSVASDILLDGTRLLLADLQEIPDGLRSKESALAEMDIQIADYLDGEAFDEDIAGAIDYRDKIGNAISRLPFTPNVRVVAGAPVSEGQLQRFAGTIDESSNAIGAAQLTRSSSAVTPPFTVGHELWVYASPCHRFKYPSLPVRAVSGRTFGNTTRPTYTLTPISLTLKSFSI